MKVLKGAKKDIVENQYIKVSVIAEEPDGRSQNFPEKAVWISSLSIFNSLP